MSDDRELPVRPASPARVSRSEAELLDLATRIISPTQRSIVALREQPRHVVRIKQIGPTAMRLLQQILARGVSAEILRRGGWETRRTLAVAQGEGQVVRGRLWERHPRLPPLHFTRASFALLSWLRAEDVADPKKLLEFKAPTSAADELLLYFAAEQVIKAGGDLKQPAFLHSPLCQLAFVNHLAGAEPLPTLDFRQLTSGDGAIMLEALQSELARRSLDVEKAKHECVKLDVMVRIGAAQDQVFAGLVRAVDLSEPRRRDLVGFVAQAARSLLAKGPERICPDHRWWVEALDLRAPLAARQAAFSAAATFLRTIGQLGRWLDDAGLVAHFDEDYVGAQLLLSSWEYLRAEPDSNEVVGHARHVSHASHASHAEHPPLPSSILDRARVLAHQLESLHSLGLPS
jgi:FtsH ternary system domain X6